MARYLTMEGAAELEAALARVDDRGRFDPQDLQAVRSLASALAGANTLVDLRPQDLLGPWIRLPESVKNHLRTWCRDEITGAMRFHPQRSVLPSMVRWLNTLDRKLESRDAPRRQAFLQRASSALWRRPRMTWKAARRWKENRGWAGNRPSVASFLVSLGKDPAWLMSGYAEGIEVDPRCRGFHRSPDRNVVWGYTLGIDLVPTPNAVVCHEANLQPGLTGRMRKGYWKEDPIPAGLVDFANEAGIRQVIWISGHQQPIDPWFYGQLHSATSDAGLELQVLEDEQNPIRTDLPAELPIPARAPFAPHRPEPNTLVVRARDLKAGPDLVLTNKKNFAQAVGDELERLGETRVRILPHTTAPPHVPLPEDPGLPNLVYKYPFSGKGAGVFFMRVEDPARAEELGREIDAQTGLSGGIFQPWVCSPMLPGRLAYEFRAMILVTPAGVRFLGARRRQTVHPFPETLPEGIVEDRSPFINTGFFGNISPARDPSLEGPIVEASLAIAESTAGMLRRVFLTTED